MHPFPLIDAFWASLNKERPSGDDPKRVASALNNFYTDLQKRLNEGRVSRWKTPLFKQLDPDVSRRVEELVNLTAELSITLPSIDQAKLDRLKALDEAVRKATFELAQEESQIALEPHPSPKLNQFNYLFRGWERGLLDRLPIEKFSAEYAKLLGTTRREIESTVNQVSPRESEQEKQSIDSAITQLSELEALVQGFRQLLPQGAPACTAIVDRLLATGKSLGKTFETLEQCAPLQDPCPFCGGQISLSGRCRSCSRRLPHLEEVAPEGGEGPTSTFLTQNCRAVDIALLNWEAEPENQDLWLEFQKAVRQFAGHVTRGHKEAEMLAMSPDRPIDSQSELRKQEETLKEVGQAFQEALTTLSKFSDNPLPPAHRLDDKWRESLREAEEKLRELQTALQPEEAS